MNLSDQNKAYRIFCANYENDIPIFLKDWWLDAVAPDEWASVHYGPGKDPIAVLPYLLRRKGPFRRITNPPLSQLGGPWIIYPDKQTEASKLKLERKITKDLLKELPSADAVVLLDNLEFTYWQAFHWQGYNVRPRICYIVPTNNQMATVEANIHSSVRQNIRSAYKNVVLRPGSPEDLMKMVHKTYSAQRLRTPFTLVQIERIHKSVLNHSSGEIIVAESNTGFLLAATFFLYDSKYMYYFKAGSDSSYGRSDAQTLILWEAFKIAEQKGLDFNFLGSTHQGVERFFSSFGPVQKTIWEYTRYSGLKGALIRLLSR